MIQMVGSWLKKLQVSHRRPQMQRNGIGTNSNKLKRTVFEFCHDAALGSRNEKEKNRTNYGAVQTQSLLFWDYHKISVGHTQHIPTFSKNPALCFFLIQVNQKITSHNILCTPIAPYIIYYYNNTHKPQHKSLHCSNKLGT